MTQTFRLPEGGHIDRDRPLSFQFNGRSYQGYGGDTLASALLANGVHLVGRSFKYHRPRGIVSAGPEEPNAIVQVGHDPRTDPNIRATQLELIEGLNAASQHCWPSVEFDIGAVNNYMSRLLPAGFYYKTFMWPAALWMKYEYFIRHAAGLGRAPRERDPDSYDKTYAHCDVLVVGAGPAGLAAALGAARAGARVILAEQDPQLGGALLAAPQETIDNKPALDWVAEALIELGKQSDVRILPRTTAFVYYDHNYLGLVERVIRPHGRQAGKPAAPAAVESSRAPSRTRHRRHRAAPRVRRQRPAGNHAGRCGTNLPEPLRGPARRHGGRFHQQRRRLRGRARPPSRRRRGRRHR